ncbi:MAG: translocation/assembly module TamB, partial [Archangium sp.]|nr:translocation/assembly module TamB [Archangium sp.]
FELVGRALNVSGTVVPGISGTAAITAQDTWPAAVSLLVDLPDASAWLPPSVTGLSLALAGAVTAQVPLRDVRSGHGTAKLSKLAVSRGEVAAANVEPVELEWNDGALTVHSLAMRGPTSELNVEGRWGPQVADLKGRGAIDARLASSLAPDLERAAGRIDFTAAVTGAVTAPTLVGTADLYDGRFSVKGQDIAVRSLGGHAEFSGSRVLLQDIQGFVNDGRLRARGDLRLEGLGVKSMEIQADLEDVTVRPRPDLPATVSGSLLLASKKGGVMQLSGGLDVVKFRYVESLSFDGVLASAKGQRVPSDDKPNEWLRLDVDVALGDDVRIENNLARARLLGKVKVGGTNVKPVLVGAIEVAEGAQAFFRNNTFTVSRGVLQFNGLWPTFDVSARSQVREYLVNVKAFGRFDDPKISLVSEPALSEADVVSLLTLGVTTRERLDTTSGAGLAAEALLSASGLDQQVQRFLSRNVGLKDQQVRLTTSFNEATGTAEPSVTWESKMLSDNLKVGVTQPVTGRGTKAQAEYRFNDRVSARAQWDNQNQNTTVGNPGVDLRFRFEWE